MKLFYKNFDKQKEQLLKTHNTFFFYGPNNYNMIETIDKISTGSKEEISKETIYCWEAEINDIAKKLTTSDLFSKKSILILRYFDKSNKAFKKDFLDFLKKYKFTNYLFILYEKELLLKDRDEIIKFLFENFVSVEYPIPTKEEIIEEFIPQRINCEITYEAKEILYENTHNDLWLLSNELEKLSYFVGKTKSKISKEDIDICCNEYELPEVKDLIDAIVNNNIYKKLDTLTQLLANNYTALGLISSLYRYFRKNFLFKKIPLQKAYKILKEIQFADYKIKTSSNSRYIVENCILKISQIYNDLL